MAQKTISVNATASLSANGTSTSTGSITWTAPALPADAVGGWDSITVSGTWSWSGRGNISRVTINGTNTSTGIAFDVNINGKTSPLSISCVGGNKNATGNSFTWSNLKVNYTYTEPEPEHGDLYVQVSGVTRQVQTVYRKVSGNWVEIMPDDLDTSANYVMV